MPKEKLLEIYNALHSHYGPQHWWPGETPFEVMVGAVLTQNTNWGNVERALANLKDADKLLPEAIDNMPEEELAGLIRPSGYFNVKTKRLKAFVRYFIERYEGSIERMKREDCIKLRQEVLAVNGIGPETADDILLYAFERPVFVIDAYTRRLFARLGLIAGDEGYETLRHAIERALGPDVQLFNEYHALIVAQAKEVCRVRPRCGNCVLRKGCPGRSDD